MKLGRVDFFKSQTNQAEQEQYSVDTAPQPTSNLLPLPLKSKLYVVELQLIQTVTDVEFRKKLRNKWADSLSTSNLVVFEPKSKLSLVADFK